jgi:hypothetical protein
MSYYLDYELDEDFFDTSEDVLEEGAAIAAYAGDVFKFNEGE